VAVLAGDWLLSTAFSLLGPYPREVTTGAIQLLSEMTRAAIVEVEARGRVDLPLSTWRTIAEGKTGALFGWCGTAAARAGGQAQLVPAFDAFGRSLGVAFQLADDLKDLLEPEAGKDRFADVRNRNPSFPLLLAMQRSASLRERIAVAWGAPAVERDEAEQLGQAVIATGATHDAARALEAEVDAAVGALGSLRDEPWCQELMLIAQGFVAGVSEAA
jgi:octaprenyl-diphosphate synthase